MATRRIINVAGYYIAEQHIETQILNFGPQQQNNTFNVQGDYIAGDKHVGTHIDNVSTGAVGAQITKD